jgi:small basic protein
VLVWLGVALMLAAIIVLAMIDMRLTAALRRRRQSRQRPSA